MVKVVLTSDRTLMSEFRNLANLDFLACMTSTSVPKRVFSFLAPPIPHRGGVAVRAPYGLRKVEAALLQGGYKPEELVVADPDHLERFIDSDTRIVGVSVMDAFGLGPLSMLASYHTPGPSFCTACFSDLLRRVAGLRGRRDMEFKIVVGGSGAWQFEFQPHRVEELELDHVIVGEAEHTVHQLFTEIEEGDNHPPVIRVRGYPKAADMPLIVNPSVHNLVEVMRGCGRNCEFCEPNLRAARYYPLDQILKEIRVNVGYGGSRAWLQSDDIFLYDLKDHKHFYPNRESLVQLFKAVMSLPGVTHSNATHGTVAPAAADPDLIREISKISKAGPDNWIGVQTGLETGSSGLIKQWMPLKGKPFSPEEWPEVVFEGTKVFNENYWFPVYTLIMGLPGETEEDVWDTIRLLDRMERELPEKVGREKAHFWVGVFPFIPIGVMRGEKMFNMDEMMTEARFLLLYRTYRHMVQELSNPAPGTLKGPWLNLGFRVFGPVGAWMLNRVLKRFASHQKYDVEKALHL